MKKFLTLSLLLIPSLAYAEGAGGQGGFGLVPVVLIFAVFYMLIIRPQMKQRKDHQNLVNSLKRDDKVITAGGIYGRITNVKGEIVEVEIADGVKVDIAKGSISAVLNNANDAVVPEVITK